MNHYESALNTSDREERKRHLDILCKQKIAEGMRRSSSICEQYDETLEKSQENNNWAYVCSWAEANILPLHEHMETWGPHCGASRETYLGHITRMLLDIYVLEKGNEL